MGTLLRFIRRPIGQLASVTALLLLGVILLPAVIGNSGHFERIQSNGERLQFYQARLGLTIIGLRHGLSNNYDEANQWVANIRMTEANISADAHSDPMIEMMWDDYLVASQASVAQLERFKLGNALVRNSLSNFIAGVHDFSQSLPDQKSVNVIRQDLSRLSNALLIEALGEKRSKNHDSPALITAIESRFDAIPLQKRSELSRLLDHAKVIDRHAFDLESRTAVMVNGDSQRALSNLLALNQQKIISEQTVMTRYRVGLLMGIIFLLAAMTLLFSKFIGERRRNERELRLAATVFSSSQQGIVFTDVSGTIVSVNQAFCQMTGYDETELLGKNPRILHSGEHDNTFYEDLWNSVLTFHRWRGEITNRRKNGEQYVQWTTIDQVLSHDGETLYVGISSDITEVIQARSRLTQLAYFDPLTGLPNRQLFVDRLEQSLARCRRDNGRLALLYADLDNFKSINDTLGHSTGDILLSQVADRLRGSIRETDTVARVGGDEFALVLNQVSGPKEIIRVAELVLKRLAEPYHLHDVEVSSGASVGIVLWPNDGNSVEVLMKNADVAMYCAKSKGRNNYQFFTQEMGAEVEMALKIESGLRRAVTAHELVMHYQPQCLADGTVVGVEALMRWYSPELGHVAPSEFIPIAEHSNLIVALGDFALVQACEQCRKWRDTLLPDLRIAVNLSGAQFKHEGLVDRIAAVLESSGLPSSALELEVTESVLMDDISQVQNILLQLKTMGCRLSIDDFGTGYSSLAYLKKFQVDSLKIDRSFVESLGETHDDQSIVRTIFGLSRSLNLEVVTEGVETIGQLDILTDLAEQTGFLVQGYYFSRPMGVDAFEQFHQQGIITRA